MKRYLPLALAILALVMLLMSGLGTRAGLWHYRTGFTILKWAGYLGIAVALGSVVALLVPRLRTGNAAAFILAILISVTVTLVPWSFKRKGRSVPPIHDITTDTERPPAFVSVLPLRANATNPPEYAGREIAEQQIKAYPDIKPIMLPVPPVVAFTIAQEAAERMHWEMVAVDSAARRIEATATTTWFGFKDDVVVRVEPDGRGSRIDVRSKSRVGRGDVGANAARIRKYVSRVNVLTGTP